MKKNVTLILLSALVLAACSSRKPKPPEPPMVEQTNAAAIPHPPRYYRTCTLCSDEDYGIAVPSHKRPYHYQNSNAEGNALYTGIHGFYAIGQLKDYFKDKGTAKSRCREMQLLLNGNAEGTKVDDAGRLLVADGPDNFRVHPFISWNYYYNNCVFNR